MTFLLVATKENWRPSQKFVLQHHWKLCTKIQLCMCTAKVHDNRLFGNYSAKSLEPPLEYFLLKSNYFIQFFAIFHAVCLCNICTYLSCDIAIYSTSNGISVNPTPYGNLFLSSSKKYCIGTGVLPTWDLWRHLFRRDVFSFSLSFFVHITCFNYSLWYISKVGFVFMLLS